MTRLPLDPDLAAPSENQEPGANPFTERSPTRVPGGFRHSLASALLVSAGGVVGGCSRYGVDQLIPASGHSFPWGTFAVNITGAFLLAVLLILVLEVWPPTRFVRPFVAVGILGSFTTFSTLIVDVDQLFAGGARTTAATYLIASIVAGLAATSAGLIMGRGLVSQRQKYPREVAR